jgi:hypothetical protein
MHENIRSGEATEGKCLHGGLFGINHAILDECPSCVIYDDCYKESFGLRVKLNTKDINKSISNPENACGETERSEVPAPEKPWDHLLDKDKKRLLSIEHAIRKKLTVLKNNIYSIGRYLAQAKKVLPHGSFKVWIEYTFGKDLPYSTAAAYKAIYGTFRHNPKTVELIPFSYLIEATRKNFPKRLRRFMNQNPASFKNWDLKTFTDTCKAYENGKIDLEEFMTEAKEQINYEANKGTPQTFKKRVKTAHETLSITTTELRRLLKMVNKNIKKAKSLVESPLESGSLPTSTLGEEENVKEFLNALLDQHLIQDINKAREQLNELENYIVEAQRLFTKEGSVE